MQFLEARDRLSNLRQFHLDKAEKINKAMEGLETAVQVLDSEPEVQQSTMATVTEMPTPKHRVSAAGRERIAEANRKFWVVCRKPECQGVKHRRTHPHIRRQLKLEKGTRHGQDRRAA